MWVKEGSEHRVRNSKMIQRVDYSGEKGGYTVTKGCQKYKEKQIISQDTKYDPISNESGNPLTLNCVILI